jgi:hypothetical protein
MNGYITHGDTTIRLCSRGYDVLIGTVAPATQFVRFDNLDEAKAFIDGGRVVTTHTVYGLATQAPVLSAAEEEQQRNRRAFMGNLSRNARKAQYDDL